MSRAGIFEVLEKYPDGWIGTDRFVTETGISMAAIRRNLKYMRKHNEVCWKKVGYAYYYQLK